MLPFQTGTFTSGGSTRLSSRKESVVGWTRQLAASRPCSRMQTRRSSLPQYLRCRDLTKTAASRFSVKSSFVKGRSCRCRFLFVGRLVLPGDSTESDGKAVPPVDGHDRKRELRQLVIREMLPSLLVDFVRHMRFGNQSYCLGPCQRSRSRSE